MSGDETIDSAEQRAELPTTAPSAAGGVSTGPFGSALTVERFHNASTTPYLGHYAEPTAAPIPLPKRLCGYGRCLARTGDLLLVRQALYQLS